MANGGASTTDHMLDPDQAPRTETKLDRGVFAVAATLALAVVAWGILDQVSLGKRAGQAQSWVIEYTGWLFVMSTTGFVVFAIWVAASRYGKIPLGRDGEKPEFRTASWIAMMFSAGMGIGLMFYGVSEPISHFVTPPPGTGASPLTARRSGAPARVARVVTATASMATSTSARGMRDSTIVTAGGLAPRDRRPASRRSTAGTTDAFATYTCRRTIRPADAPAAARATFRFSRT